MNFIQEDSSTPARKNMETKLVGWAKKRRMRQFKAQSEIDNDPIDLDHNA